MGRAAVRPPARPGRGARRQGRDADPPRRRPPPRGGGGAGAARRGAPPPPAGARRGDREFYDLVHGGHRSVVLDPGTTAGRRALAGLVAAADVVIEASRPRALAGFGLDA